MKHIIYSIFISLICTCLFAETYTVGNNLMSVSIDISADNNTVLSSIKDLSSNQEFIKETNPKSPLWLFTIKENGKYSQEPIFLYPKNAESLNVEKTNTGYIFKYNNVKIPQMNEGFNVICSFYEKNNNTYWSMNISRGKEYGIWHTEFPRIINLDTQNGDSLFIPTRGDVFITKFDDPRGFEDPRSQLTDKYTKSFNPDYPKFIQYTSLSKGPSVLYMCPEDLSGTFRQIDWCTDKPNTMNVICKYFPAYMGEAGHPYVQKCPYCISAFQGDWFDAAKKYRKWGIDNKYAPFSQGKIENRKDLPRWWKEHTLSMQTYFGRDKQFEDNAFKAAEYFDIPIMFQLYEWSAFSHDTHYPNWLPMREGLKEKLNKLKDQGNYLIPYTNCHLIDIKRSDTVKKYNDPNILAITDYKGNRYETAWGAKRGALNVQGCSGSPFMKEYLDEIRRIFREYPFDALYIDQVGGTSPTLCFNKSHNHPVGGGTFVQDNYIKIIKEARKIIKEETGKDVPITTEDGGDAFTFDGFLKVNECTAKSAENIVRGVVFSGYVLNHGIELYNGDLNAKDDWPIISKYADMLCKGYALGWGGLLFDKYWNHTKALEYLKSIAEARYSAVNYFNLGEQVRCVNITSKNPTMKITWDSAFGMREQDFHTIKTCSFNWHGKTMVCFTNASDNTQKIDWNTNPKDIYLKEKKTYTIKETWPEKKILSKGNKIENSLAIGPLETIILTIE